MLPFIIAGLTTGSVYGLAGIGLVLTYKTSGIFNFAHGAVATVSAYSFYTLYVQLQLPWPVAAIISVFVLGPAMGLGFERIARVLARTPMAMRVAAMIGILLIVEGTALLIYGDGDTNVRTVPRFLGTHEFHVADIVFGADQLIVFLLGILATAVLYLFLRRSRTGVAMRAVVDNPDLLGVCGTSPVVVRRWAWMIGVTFASASGVLLVPFINMDSDTLTFLVVAAFGAAALGRFVSLPGAYFGGLVIGVAGSLATKFFTSGALTQLSASVPFLVLFLVLLVAPKRWLADHIRIVPPTQTSWRGPWQVQTLFGIVALAVLLFVPSFAGFRLADWTSFLAITIMFLSLGLLVRTAGQVSLCQISFMAIGACAFSHLAVGNGWPWGLALLVSGLIAVPIGALLAIPAIRLSGLYLAISTFGFGILLQYLFYQQDFLFGVLGYGIDVPMPVIPWLGQDGSPEPYYYLVLGVAVITTGLVVAINRSRLGRLLRALASSPTGLATSGASVNVTRVLVFCISAFLASVAGVLQAGAFTNVTSASYEPIESLVFFVLVIISPGGVPWFALMSGIGSTVIASYLTGVETGYILQIFFGIGVLVIALQPASKRGAPEWARTALDKLFRKEKPAETQHAAVEPAARREPAAVAPTVLQVKDLKVQFGGLIAVDGIGFEAPPGRITGLIGPNGAGKTTTFNSCSGLNRPTEGDVMLNGVSIARRGPASRARSGLGRTFQQMELFDELTVWENVAIGREAGRAGLNALQHIASTPSTKIEVDTATEDALRECDLLELADRRVDTLSTGQRRLVEFARCLAGPFSTLLLDEPSSGLDRAETARFGEILQHVVTTRGIGILLVEHDMALVTAVCDYIYVLDFGKPIFEGAPDEVMSSPLVQAAYLGGDVAVDDDSAAGAVTARGVR
ncbi:branched-chain amino acid ABC transporter permease/ATP-binding protein [Pseudonocardia ailaonensis]|uniref:Branched-chain amino acid ABC transporter permease/ATP-binding protein n=1 Tax=Pseudonocardia ailaonensis TaxID=367279 RepID=A0ABN2NJE8_9PSEU